MKTYWRVYKAFMRFNLMRFLTYRANFVNSLVSSLAWGVFQLVWIFLLTSRTTSAFGWSRHELITLAIAYSIVIGLLHFLFTRNFDRFSMIIDKGDLDFLLLKPLDSQFMATTYLQGYPHLIRVALGVVLLVIYLTMNHIAITFFGVANFIILSVFGIVLLYSLWLLYSSVIVWFPRLTNIIDFLYTINGMARYPSEMMREIKNFIIFFVLPFALTIATPTKILIRNVWDGDVILLIVISTMFFVASRLFWKFALRHYISASS